MSKALAHKLSDRDIIIVGGGLVGNSMAMALSGLGFRLAIVDNKPAALTHAVSAAETPAKALALSLSTQRFLQALGLWEGLKVGASPILAVHISEQGRFGRTLLKAADSGLPALGFVVDSNGLEQQLWHTVQRLPDVKIIQDTTVSDRQLFNNPLIIAADGAHSKLRTQAGINTALHDYRQTAMVVNVRLKQSHQGVAYERFTTAGPIAMLPFGNQQVKCVWVVSTKKYNETIRHLSDGQLIETLTRHFGHRLGPFVSIGLRSAYPLSSRVAEGIYGEKLVLIGNAAATLHPIAAQGFNLAVRDIAALAENLLQAKQAGQAIGAGSVLQAYAKQRNEDRAGVIQLTHQLAEGFESSCAPLKHLRHWGLVLFEMVPNLKKWVINRGVGFQYPLPKLCCGVRLCP